MEKIQLISRIWFVLFMSYLIIKEGAQNTDNAIIVAIIGLVTLGLLDILLYIRGCHNAAKIEQTKRLEEENK